MDNMRSIVTLQQLPIEILSMIVEKVGKASSADYAKARATFTKMKEASKSPKVFYSLCLSPLVKTLCTLAQVEFLETCVEHENFAAFFIRGILAYFIENDPDNGMAYLQLGAIGEGADFILDAAFLYGVLRLLYGDPVEGEEYMALMNWWDEDDLKTANDVWANLRKSLHGITVWKKRVYVQLLHNMMPPDSCNLRDLETACPYCFHYKRVLKFFHMY